MAATSGMIHSALGPFDIAAGSNLGYTRVNYVRKALKINAGDPA